MRVAVRFAYDGACFQAYAREPDRHTVEGSLQAALADDGMVKGSWRTGSRTDRGVCALENVAACTLDRPHLHGLAPSLQSRLPDGVWVTGAAPVDASWDPRRAIRTYQYDTPEDGEDPERLTAACRAFTGRHHMGGFARVEPGRDPVRDITSFTVQRTPEGWRFQCSSPGFLWNQVRRMVAYALRVARGQADLASLEDALRTGAPPKGADVAPAQGLLLRRVAYDPEPTWQAGVDLRRLHAPLAAARHRLAVLEHVLQTDA